MKNNQFSEYVTVFRRYTLPETDMKLAGYSALINRYDLEVPIPEQISAISQSHRQYEEGRWNVRSKRHEPDHTLQGHLTFALKYEGVHLLILKKLFEKIGKAEIKAIVKPNPPAVTVDISGFSMNGLQMK